MKTKTIALSVGLLVAAASSLADNPPNQLTDHHLESGKFLFDQETFGGNGRTCVTCHGQKSGTLSITDIEKRFAKNPLEPLFRSPDSDNLDGQTYHRLLETGTIKIDVPLPLNVKIVGHPTATTASVFRGIPTTRNTPTLQQFLMADGRETSANLQHQALSAVHQHTENTVAPSPAQLDKIAEFEQTDPRFYSSEALRRFSVGGPMPKLPPGHTPSEKRGREFFRPDRQCGVCHSGPMLDTTSEFDQLSTPGSRFHAVLAGLVAGPLAESFDADGNFLVDPNNPNRNQMFEFALPDNGTIVVVSPDPGRALVTGDPNDAFFFKIPTLWGIKDTAPYFHDNSARTLEAVMDHYNRFFQFINDQIPDLFPLMSEQDKADIVAFMKLL